MRILQVASYFHPHVGGLENYVLELSRRLVKRGHEVEVFTSNLPRTRRHEIIGGVKVYRLDTVCTPFGNPIGVGMLERLSHVRDFDIIHAHDEHAFTSNLAAFVARLTGVPLIVTSHGRSLYEGLIERLILSTYERTAMYATLRCARATTVLSEADRRYLVRLGIPKESIKVIPNAIDLSLYDSKHDSEAFRRKYGLEGSRVILFVGQLLRRKGVQYIIRAMPSILEHFGEAKLLIIGNGEFGRELAREASECGVKDSVIFLGQVSSVELRQAYSVCDVLVLPSLAEGVPTVILEAMAMSRPVVASPIPCIKEYFEEITYLVEPTGVRDLSNAVVRLLEDESICSELGRKGRELVEKRFRWEDVTEGFLQLYETLRD